MNKQIFFARILFLGLVINVASTLHAQEADESVYFTDFRNRKWLIELPLWIPGFQGKLVYGSFDSSSSGDDEEREFERLTGNPDLEFYVVGRIVANYDKWWFQADLFSGKVSTVFTYEALVGAGEKEFFRLAVQGTVPRLIAGYTVWEQQTANHFAVAIVPYTGIRYAYIDLESQFLDSSLAIDTEPNWFEPVFGLYVPLDYKRFRFEGQGDFGINKAKQSWQVNTRLRYRLSKLVDVQLGWTYLNLSHETSIESKEFDLDLILAGPTAGVGFRF